MAHRKLRQFSPPAHEPQLSRDQRRAGGVYYTPPEIVRLIVDLTLEPLRGPPRVLDPACGAGEFLVAASERIASRFGFIAAGRSIHGVDIDGSAIAAAQQRLQESGVTLHHLFVADALNDDRLPPASFDVVLGNPPYLSIRQLAKSLPTERTAALKNRFRTARGNFDLYVLFIERALELLRPGGRCGFVIPNKWATLDYARTCRELLLEQATIEQVIDLSNERAFAKASVYPYVLVFRKEPAKSRHLIKVCEYQQTRPSFDPQTEAQAIDVGHTVQQRALCAAAFTFAVPLDVEARVPTQPLGNVAKLSCGTAGYSARRIADCLRDVEEGDPNRENAADFITSGNIDRYQIRLGDVRYLNHTYDRPRLPFDSPEVSAAKRKLFTEPKIVIAGMSRRMEAAWDAVGLALGVQVFAASDCQIDPFYLLALLNSKLLSFLFATRFAAKRLAGGYLAINKGQLARLPVVVGTRRVPSIRRLSELAASWGRRLACHKNEADDVRLAARLPDEEEADQLVYQLYRLSDAEIARVEAHFAPPAARAA